MSIHLFGANQYPTEVVARFPTYTFSLYPAVLHLFLKVAMVRLAHHGTRFVRYLVCVCGPCFLPRYTPLRPVYLMTTVPHPMHWVAVPPPGSMSATTHHGFPGVATVSWFALHPKVRSSSCPAPSLIWIQAQSDHRCCHLRGSNLCHQRFMLSKRSKPLACLQYRVHRRFSCERLISHPM
ncbi:hypothetical protein BC830DRAFT_698480 [Chytriomyces sp. MP71]|nr:hypothetical protein BC830DRAFT_698480 [Chytriomyces sp. MP71]